MTILLDEKEIKCIEKKVFLTLKEDINKEVKEEVKKLLLIKKKERYENQLSFL